MAKQPQDKTDIAVATKSTINNLNVRKFKVILHNDDYTTFDFVIAVLMDIFSKTFEEAESITTHVHLRGQGIAGYYTREIADTKVAQVHAAAEAAGFPLRASVQSA